MRKLCIFFVVIMLCAMLCFSAFADVMTPGLPGFGGGTSTWSVIVAAILSALSFIYMWFHRKK